VDNYLKKEGVIMSNNYEDRYGRLHHKPVTETNPIPSNNGWIYTAYSEKIGIRIDYQKLEECYKQCRRQDEDTGRVYLVRSPQKEIPPNSRDEFLGMAALGLLKAKDINGFNFSPRTIPRFNPIKLVKQLLEVKGKHRNYFWENNLDQMYRFAYSVPLTDRHFILQNTDIKVNMVSEFIYWAIAKVDSMSKNRSGIRWLKYGKGLEEMKTEFPEDHPIRTHNGK
jgi:hypothetical protein